MEENERGSEEQKAYRDVYIKNMIPFSLASNMNQGAAKREENGKRKERKANPLWLLPFYRGPCISACIPVPVSMKNRGIYRCSNRCC